MLKSRIKKFFLISIILISSFITANIMADSTQAYCELYTKDKAAVKSTCNFSQYQGNIYIDIPKTVSLNFIPQGDQPGNYKDVKGNPVYAKKGLGLEGRIFQWQDKVLYVYWEKPENKFEPAHTEIKPLDYQQVKMVIQDNAFDFSGILQRKSDNTFLGKNKDFTILFLPNTGEVIVFHQETLKVLYDYFQAPIPTFENPDTMCNPKKESC